MGDENLDPAQYSKNVYRAIIANDKELLLNDLLLDEHIPAGFQINEYSNFGRTLLHYAAQHCDVDVVRRLIALGADVNSPMVRVRANPEDDRFQLRNSYPIMIAINRGDREMVELLIRRGCRLDVGGLDGLTPLLRTTVNGNVTLLNVIARILSRRDQHPLRQVDRRGLNALNILCAIAVTHIISNRPVPPGILQCAVYLIVAYQPPFYTGGFMNNGEFSAPEILRRQVARRAALERVAQEQAKREEKVRDHGRSVESIYDKMVADAVALVPAESNVERTTPRIDDFGMTETDFREIYYSSSIQQVLGIRIADAAAGRRKQLLLAYADRDGLRERQAELEGERALSPQDLYLAIRSVDLGRVRRQVEVVGANVNGILINNTTPLTAAISAAVSYPIGSDRRRTCIEIIRYLVGMGANINQADGRGETPVGLTAGGGEIRIALGPPAGAGAGAAAGPAGGRRRRRKTQGRARRVKRVKQRRTLRRRRV